MRGRKGNLIRIREWRLADWGRVESVRGAGVARAVARHAHQSWCVGVVVRGQRVLSRGDQAMLIAAGESFCIPPDAAHACRPGPCGDQDYIAACFAPGAIPWRGGLHPFALGCDRALAAALSDLASAGGEDAASRATGALVGRLSARLGPIEAAEQDERSAWRPAVRRLMDVVETIDPEEQSLADLSRMVGVSPFHLHRLATAQLGMTPRELALCARLRRARRMLQAGSTAAEAALDAGFFDQSHFIRHFKAHMGQTPGRVFASEGSIEP